MTLGERVKIWDPVVRIIHWSLAAAFLAAYLTEEELLDPHTWAGYAVLALVTARLIWGVFGTRYARFGDFVRGPRAVLAYLRDLLLLRNRRFLGHNPAGGAMIVAMLASLLVTGLTGMAMYGAAHGAGPLAAVMAGYAGSGHALEEVHEFFAGLTLVMVGLHVAGVLAASVLHRENLVAAMFHGYKRKNP